MFTFSLSACTAATYIFTAPTCTTTIISLEPCALNAEFQHFIPRVDNFPYFVDTTERGDAKAKEIGGEMEGDFTDNCNVYVITNNKY